MSASISIVVVAYDAGEALVRCLHSLEDDARRGAEVIVVNNGGEGPEIREARELTFVHLVTPGSNVGFAAGCNLGAREATGDVLLFLNPDTVVAAGAVAELARTLDAPLVGIAMPRLRLLERPELLNSSGNVVHLTGIAWAGGYGEPADAVADEREVAYASGAALAIRRTLFEELGGFTEELFMYQEDLELGWRVRMRGLRIVLNPRADVYHEYEFARHRTKHYLLERNRLVFVLSAYSGRLLAVLSPVLVSAELALLALATREGWARDKVRGWSWCVRNARWLARHRRDVQAGRRVPDRDLAAFLTPELSPAMISVPGAIPLANRLVAAYWRAARRLV